MNRQGLLRGTNLQTPSLSLTRPSESSNQHAQQQAVCHSDALIKSIIVTQGQKQPFTLTSTQQTQQDIGKSLAIFRSKSLSSLDSDDSNKTMTSQLSGLFLVPLWNTRNNVMAYKALFLQIFE